MPFIFPPPTPAIIRQVEIPDPNVLHQFYITGGRDGPTILNCYNLDSTMTNCVEGHPGWFPRFDEDEK